jgi:hypothetical protein
MQVPITDLHLWVEPIPPFILTQLILIITLTTQPSPVYTDIPLYIIVFSYAFLEAETAAYLPKLRRTCMRRAFIITSSNYQIITL